MKSKLEQKKFQSYEDKTENGQQQVQKLDDETERRITAFQDAALDYQHARDHGKEVVWSNVVKAEAALRSRVRELCKQAREEGRVSTLSLHRENLRGGAFFAEVDRLRDEVVISDNPDKESR